MAYVLGECSPRAGAIGLQVLVEMNDAGEDQPVSGLDCRAIAGSRLDQQAQGQGDQRCHQPHRQLDDVDGLAAQVMFRKPVPQGHADAGAEQRTEEGQGKEKHGDHGERACHRSAGATTLAFVRPLVWSPTASSPPNYAEGPAHHISWDRSVGRRSSTKDRANAFRAKVDAGGRNALQGDLCIKAPSCSSSHFLRGRPPP